MHAALAQGFVSSACARPLGCQGLRHHTSSYAKPAVQPGRDQRQKAKQSSLCHKPCRIRGRKSGPTPVSSGKSVASGKSCQQQQQPLCSS